MWSKQTKKERKEHLIYKLQKHRKKKSSSPISPTPQPLATTNLFSVSMCLVYFILFCFVLFYFVYQRQYTAFDFLCLTYCTQHNALEVHPCCCKWQDFILFIYVCMYVWLCQVFIAARGLSLVAASGGYSSLRCVGFSLQWLLLLQSTGSRRAGFSSCGMRAQQLWYMGLVALQHVGSSRTRA